MLPFYCSDNPEVAFQWPVHHSEMLIKHSAVRLAPQAKCCTEQQQFLIYSGIFFFLPRFLSFFFSNDHVLLSEWKLAACVGQTWSRHQRKKKIKRQNNFSSIFFSLALILDHYHNHNASERKMCRITLDWSWFSSMEMRWYSSGSKMCSEGTSVTLQLQMQSHIFIKHWQWQHANAMLKAA